MPAFVREGSGHLGRPFLSMGASQGVPPHPTIRSIQLDTAGWQLKEESASAIVWRDDGDGIGLYFFPIPPDLPASPTEIDALRLDYRRKLARAGGAVVEVEPLDVDGVPAVRTVVKLPQEAGGMTYVASITVPFADFSYVLKFQCHEGTPTGLRESVVLSKLLHAGDVSQGDDGKLSGWWRDPYEPAHEAPLLRNRAEDEGYDELFPDHPLSRARRHLARAARGLRLGEPLLEWAPYRPELPAPPADPATPHARAIDLDTAGWYLRHAAERRLLWGNTLGDTIQLDVDPEPGRPWPIERMRDLLRDEAARANGALLSVESASLQGVPMLRALLKYGKPEGTARFVALLVVHGRRCCASIRIECGVASPIGAREAAVRARLIAAGELPAPAPGGSPAGWAEDPYAPGHRAPVLRDRSDDERHDADFPDHALSRLRRYVAHVEATARLSPAVLDPAPREAAAREPAPPPALAERAWWQFWKR